MRLLNKFRKREDEQLRSSPAEEAFQEAVRLSDQERHGEALLAFRRVLELDPGFQPDVVHLGIALAYEAQGMDDLALEELAMAISHNPASVEARFLMGAICARLGRYEEAAREYEAVLSICPGHELAGEMRRSIERWKALSSGETLRGMRRELAVFIEQAYRQFGVALDLTPQSLSLLDGLIDGGWNLQTGGPGVLRIAGAYMGEVIVRNLGGQWRVADPPEESVVTGVVGGEVRPFLMVLKKFRDGRGASLFRMYCELARTLR
ncbi:MAG: tetratricopeptide repeat protein [Thermoplasmata archaeon]